MQNATTPLTDNTHVTKWVDQMAALTKPDRIVWCDGSDAENKANLEQAVRDGLIKPLNQKKRPNCYIAYSKPNDVARVEHLTFICTPTKEEAGPNNNWMAPNEAYEKLA